MALWEFSNQNKHGNWKTRVVDIPKGESFSIPKGFGNVCVSRFRYIHKHPILPPVLTTGKDGIKYLLPTWTPVHPQTTLDDIKWEKPEVVKVKPQKNEWLFESSSDPGNFYRVRQNGVKLTCNCSGFYRVKDREKGCKHAQQVRKELGL